MRGLQTRMINTLSHRTSIHTTYGRHNLYTQAQAILVRSHPKDLFLVVVLAFRRSGLPSANTFQKKMKKILILKLSGLSRGEECRPICWISMHLTLEMKTSRDNREYDDGRPVLTRRPMHTQALVISCAAETRQHQRHLLVLTCLILMTLV